MRKDFGLKPTVLLAAVGVLAVMSGCSTMHNAAGARTEQECASAYRRGDNAHLVKLSERIDKLEDPCRHLVLQALGEEDPEGLLEVATDTGDRGLVVAAVLAAGASGRKVKVPHNTRRLLGRSRDGGLVLGWLETGKLSVMAGYGRTGQELVKLRRDVARLLWAGAEEAELRKALRPLALSTERAMQEGDVFGLAVPAVPIRPTTTSVRALSLKLALVPYLTETPPSVALSLIEGSEGRGES